MVNSELDRHVIRQLQARAGDSRVQLARQLDVSPSTMGIHVDRLLQQGLLCEGLAPVLATQVPASPQVSTSGGRPPKVLQLNPEAGQFIGIDFDAKEIFAISIDFAQRRLRDRVWEIQAKDRAEDVLTRIEAAIEDVRDQHRPLLGIGIASPGAIDVSSGTSLHYEFIRNWKDVPLNARFAERFGVPVYVENNVRAMALAEQSFGKARFLDSAICIGNRSGIGAGVLIQGELYRGPDGLAGEIGGWPVRLSRGKVSTLEKTSSLRSLMKGFATSIREGQASVLRLHHNQVTWESLLAAIEADDPMVLRALGAAADILGKAIAQMSLVFNPQAVVVCGPLAEVDEAFMGPLGDSLREHLPKMNSKIPDLRASSLGRFVGALGAGALASRQWKPI